MTNEMLLSPLARVYDTAAAARNAAYDKGLIPQAQVPLPVLSVGNISLGGTGKSPFTAYLAASLLARGCQPVILSRGYGGSLKGPHVVAKKDLPEKVGDEALMHCLEFAGAVPVVISRRRAAGAKLIAEKKLGDVILLDDGFQHRRLARDVDLVLIDEARGSVLQSILEKRLLPWGSLREDPENAFRRVSAVVFVGRHPVSGPSVLVEQIKELYLKNIPVFHFELKPSHFVDVFTGAEKGLEEFAGSKAKALTAIASGDAFFRMLQTQGIDLTEQVSFRDHHQFRWAEWNQVIDARVAPVFCTAKDAVKLKPFVSAAEQLYMLKLDGGFSLDTARDEFWNLLKDLSGISN